jgi:hypothetical protein
MSRYIRKTAILSKIEAVYGTDAVPTGSSNALLVSNCTVNPLNANNVKRDLVRPYFGGSEELVGTAFKEVSFDVELVGSGTAGTAPAWGPLLRAAGMAETVTAATRVDYLPLTDSPESATIYYYLDGLLYSLLGARGTFTCKLDVGGRPLLSFKFTGIDGGETASANPTVDLTSWKTPRVVTSANSGSVTIGATHSAIGAPELTGGTAYTSQGLELDIGNTVSFIPLLGNESVDITDRETTGKLTLDLSAADEVTFMGDVRGATLQSVGLVHGVTAGLKVLVFAPSVQFINPSKQDVSGRAMSAFDLRALPVAGNDELRIVAF